MKIYRLQRSGNLCWLKTAIGNQNGEVSIFRLLVDTGASITILPERPLKSLGYDFKADKIRLVGANGPFDAPLIKVAWINCLGVRAENFSVGIHTLSGMSYLDGVLGMDFLVKYQCAIFPAENVIRMP
jgi:predicted aspartyl protease